MGRPAAAASFVAGLMLLVSGMIFIPEGPQGDRAGARPLALHRPAVGRVPRPGPHGPSALLLLGVFLYLFRASTRAAARCRSGSSTSCRRADRVRDRDDLRVQASTSPTSSRPARRSAGTPATSRRADAGQRRARGTSTAGTVGVAFLFVMLPLRARRVGAPRRSWESSADRRRARRVGQLPGLGDVLRRSGSARSARCISAGGRAGAGPLGRPAGRAVADGRGAGVAPMAGEAEEPPGSTRGARRNRADAGAAGLAEGEKR